MHPKKSKYREDCLCLVERENIKSTRQILKELEAKVKKVINWHMVYKILQDLEKDGRIRRITNNAGLFWIKI